MMYKEIQSNLFTAPADAYFVHCISADFAMGKGIAPIFTQKFNTKYNLLKKYPNYYQNFCEKGIIGDCILDGKVFNLITKVNYWQKPTLETMSIALDKLHDFCTELNVKKLAMPKIGCGLDRLNWIDVSAVIKEKFNDLDIDVTVYYL